MSTVRVMKLSNATCTTSFVQPTFTSQRFAFADAVMRHALGYLISTWPCLILQQVLDATMPAQPVWAAARQDVARAVKLGARVAGRAALASIGLPKADRVACLGGFTPQQVYARYAKGAVVV